MGVGKGGYGGAQPPRERRAYFDLDGKITTIQELLDAITGTEAPVRHDALLGLGDDDHPHYALADGSRGSFDALGAAAAAQSAAQSYAASQDANHVAAGDPHTQYAETVYVDAEIAAISVDLGYDTGTRTVTNTLGSNAVLPLAASAFPAFAGLVTGAQVGDLEGVIVDLAAHEADTVDAHAATAISADFTALSPLSKTWHPDTIVDVEDSLYTIIAEIDGRITAGDTAAIIDAINNWTGGDPVISESGVFQANVIVSDAIASNAIVASKIAANEVTTAKLATDAIKSTNYVYTSGNFSDAGSFFNLADGDIITPGLFVDGGGDVTVKGDITGTAFSLENASAEEVLRLDELTGGYFGVSGKPAIQLMSPSATEVDLRQGLTWDESFSGVQLVSEYDADGLGDIWRGAVSVNGGSVSLSAFYGGAGTYLILDGEDAEVSTNCTVAANAVTIRGFDLILDYLSVSPTAGTHTGMESVAGYLSMGRPLIGANDNIFLQTKGTGNVYLGANGANRVEIDDAGDVTFSGPIIANHGVDVKEANSDTIHIGEWSGSPGSSYGAVEGTAAYLLLGRATQGADDPAWLRTKGTGSLFLGMNDTSVMEISATDLVEIGALQLQDNGVIRGVNEIEATHGSVTDPSYTFVSATGAGMYKESSGIAFSFAGDMVGRFDQTNAWARGAWYTASTAGFYARVIDGNGRLAYHSSSAKVKKDIEDLELDRAKDIVKKSRPVWFRPDNDTDRDDYSFYGLIAEEVKEIDPRFVQMRPADDCTCEIPVDEEGQLPKDWIDHHTCELEAGGVDYPAMVAPLLSTVKDLMERVEELEAQLTKGKRK